MVKKFTLFKVTKKKKKLDHVPMGNNTMENQKLATLSANDRIGTNASIGME